jgi:hypothetical protein
MENLIVSTSYARSSEAIHSATTERAGREQPVSHTYSPHLDHCTHGYRRGTPWSVADHPQLCGPAVASKGQSWHVVITADDPPATSSPGNLLP